MKRMKLLGSALGPRQCVLQFEKKKQFLDDFSCFLHDLGFASWETARLLTPLGAKDTGKPILKYANTLYDDKYFSFKKGQYHIELFFGKKKVIVVINLLEEKQQEVLERVKKYCE